MLAEKFTQVFREEHRKIRDTLLELIDAFSRSELKRARDLLKQVAQTAGPHFRYEEESLYPALVKIFGDEYVDFLYSEHDRAISRAGRLVQLAQKESLSEQETDQAVQLIRKILPHVSDCDGLSIMVERLPEKTVQNILDTRDRSNIEGLNLMQWVDQVRKRPVPV